MTKEQAKKRIEYLRDTIEYNSRLYYENDAPEISDYEYDAMFRELGELEVEFPEVLKAHFTPESLKALIRVLALDPRPQYQDFPDKVYGMPYEDYDIRFRVADGVLQVVEIKSLRS